MGKRTDRRNQAGRGPSPHRHPSLQPRCFVRSHRTPSRFRPVGPLALLTLALVGATPGYAQDLGDALEGAAVGLVVSIPVLVGYSAALAQAGHPIWNADQALGRATLVGAVVTGLSVGVALGAGDRYRAGDALLGGLVVGAAGAATGLAVTSIAGASETGRWAGTLVGWGAGTLIGSVVLALAREDDGASEVPLFEARLPLALPGVAR